MPAYTTVSCTPFNNLIPVKNGQKWKYRNNPPHFSDGIGVIPSIVIFDSEKQPIQAYKKGLSDDYTTEFTIPVGGTWMAVVYYNDQEYVLQKLTTAKPYDEDELVNDIMASYRTYSLITSPVKKTLNKGYICFGTDDLRRGQTKQLHELYTNNNIPYYMAAIAGAVKGCVTDDPYKTNLDYMRMCVNNGGEIICHSADVITENNKTDFNTMYKYFCKNKKQLEFYGFNIRGIFKAGGTNAIYTDSDPIIDAWATHYYDFGDLFTDYFPYRNGRTLLDDWANYDGLDSVLQNVCENHGYVIFGLHAYNAKAEEAISHILEVLSDYERGVDYEFVTPSQLYDALMPTAPATISPVVDTNTTYSLSISNNIITLTGSDNVASTITLPVYNGGVST